MLLPAWQLFASAKVSPGSEPLSLWVVPRPHLPTPYATAQLLAKQISELGLRVEIKQAQSIAQFYEITNRGSYDLLLSGWIPDTSDPLDVMETLFTSDCIPGPADGTRGSNFARWSNADFDEAVNLQRTVPSEQNWKKVCQLLSQQVPAFPLMYGPHMGVVSWRVKKFPRDFGFRPFLAEIEL